MYMKTRKLILCVLTLVMMLTACSIKEHKYNYNNLMNEQDVNELHDLFALNSVPAEDINILFDFIRVYNNAGYAQEYLQGSWKSANAQENIYDYPTAIDTYMENPFDDLSCREAAFIAYNSFLKMADDYESEILKENSSLFDGLAILNLVKDTAFYTHYEALFSSFTSEAPISDAVADNWRTMGIEFNGDNIHLVSLWGQKDGKIINMHCGLFLQNGDKNYFFEKTDPFMPYQMSIFSSMEDMKVYLLNRENEDIYKDKTVFVDYNPL